MGALRLVKRPLVFLIEDNEDVREAFAELLQNEGYTVATASNGQEAMELLPKLGEPAIIFLDLNMPVMNGKDFLKARKSANLAPKAPVVVFAAAKHHEPLDGVAHWIRKPVDADVLLKAVESYGRLNDW